MRFSRFLLILLLYVSEFRSSAFTCSDSPPTRMDPKITVCGTDNDTIHPYSEDIPPECSYMIYKTYTFDHCDSDTSSTSPACWQVLDDSGTVNVTFVLLPQKCHYTRYEAKLIVFETSDHNCPSYSSGKIHSEKNVCVHNCLEPSCSGVCTQRGTVTFQHVFSGCYNLLLIPYKNQQPYNSLRFESDFSYLSTDHVKTPIQSEISLLHDIITDGLSLIAANFTKPTTSHFILMQDVDKSKGGEACEKSGRCIATCDTFLEHRDIQCNSDGSKTNVSCSYQSEKVISCKFTQLKAGNYCVRLAFDDDRCSPHTVWDNNNDTFSNCVWETPVIEIIPKKPETEKRTSDPGINSVLLTLIILVVLVILALTWWIVHHRIDPYKKFYPIPPITSQVPERSKILLLYARDCPAFMDAVAELRTVLKKACDCEVMDCWEESQYENVAQGPTHWLMSLLSEGNVRTVLVTSSASVLFETCMVKGSRVRYQLPKAFDCIFTQALNSLHETYSHETYKSLFIVRLDSRGEEMLQKLKTYLNPLTTYELPLHLNALLANLQNMNPTECRILETMEPDVRCLTSAIAEYQQYLSNHPHYLDSLLVTDNGTTVYTVLE